MLQLMQFLGQKYVEFYLEDHQKVYLYMHEEEYSEKLQILFMYTADQKKQQIVNVCMKMRGLHSLYMCM